MSALFRYRVREDEDGSRHPGYRVSAHGPFDRVCVGDLRLDAGGELRRAELGVVTLGELSPKADNAVLLTTWYSGSHAAYVRNYFVIIVNQLGNGFSTSSIDPDQDSKRLPSLSIVDDVVAQERLVREEFGIERLALVLGCSMGGMQAYEWAARFPDRVARVAAVAATATLTPYTEILSRTVLRSVSRALGEEPELAALRRHADLWALFGYSEAFWNNAGWMELGFRNMTEFLETGFEPLMLSRSTDVLADLAGKWLRAGRYADGGTIPLERITARTAVIPVSHDRIFPPDDCIGDAARIQGARVDVIDSRLGHLAILGASASYREQFDRIVGELLSA